MSTAAPAAPSANTLPAASAELPGPTVLPLPTGLAAAVDELDERPVHPVRVRHPRTGEVFRLVPEAVARATASPAATPTLAAAPEETAGGIGRPFTPAEKAEYDAGVSDMEAILEGIAEADAGLCRPVEEAWAEMEAEFPFLREHLDRREADGRTGGDPSANGAARSDHAANGRAGDDRP